MYFFNCLIKMQKLGNRPLSCVGGASPGPRQIFTDLVRPLLVLFSGSLTGTAWGSCYKGSLQFTLLLQPLRNFCSFAAWSKNPHIVEKWARVPLGCSAMTGNATELCGSFGIYPVALAWETRSRKTDMLGGPKTKLLALTRTLVLARFSMLQLRIT